MKRKLTSEELLAALDADIETKMGEIVEQVGAGGIVFKLLRTTERVSQASRFKLDVANLLRRRERLYQIS